MNRFRIDLAVGLLLLIATTCRPATAQTFGIVMDDFTQNAVVFDADTVLAAIPIPGFTTGDCTIFADQSLAFVTASRSEVWVIDLTTSPPSLASGINPIQISPNIGLDISLSFDQRYLSVCAGDSLNAPISLIDAAKRIEVDTHVFPTGCNSVEFCRDGSMMTSSFLEDKIRRFIVDEDGQLIFTGEEGYMNYPNNIVCSPTGLSTVRVRRESKRINSYTTQAASLRPWTSTNSISTITYLRT